MGIEIGGVQVNRIHRLAADERAAFVSHRIPGLEGNLVQRLGRHSVQLNIEGIFYGPTASDDLDKLRQFYKDGQPVDLLADIVGQAYFSQVVIEHLEVYQSADGPDEFGFVMRVAEYVVPPEPAAAQDLSGVDASIADAAQSFMAAATLPDMLGSVPNISNPLQPLSGALTGVKDAMSSLQGIGGSLESLFGKN